MLDPSKPNATPGYAAGRIEVLVTADSSTDRGFTTDPGIRLLTRIGDFVGPLTRFDRGHLALESSEHVNVDVVVRQAFRVTFETSRSEGNGALPQGVTEVGDAASLERETAGRLASSRAAVPARLAAWAEQHGETPTDKPTAADCFTQLPPIGHVETCAPCQGAGKIACSLCNAAGTLTCEACQGRGANPCTTCNATGSTTCATCKGMRTVVTQKQNKVWDEAAGANRVEHVQETVTCTTCSGNGTVACGKCNGRTTITCTACHGQKTIPCKQCQGSGYRKCETCGGEGRRYHMTQLSCAVTETFETSVRASDPETANVLKGLGSIEKVLAFAESHRATTETAADTLRRDTTVATPVTTVTVQVSGARAQVRGFGPDQIVLDYRNIAGMLLSDDLVVLEDTIKTTSLIPPHVHDALRSSLATMLASKANAAIGENAAKKDQTGIVSTFKGVVTADYITRAGAAIRTGTSRAYWAALAKGPAAVLAIPLIQFPIELIVRGQGQGPRLMALIGVMLVTFFAALAAHYWVGQQLQKRLAPEGEPKIPRLLDKLNLTRNWLVAAGIAAAVLTLGVASLAGAIFPMPALTPPG